MLTILTLTTAKVVRRFTHRDKVLPSHVKVCVLGACLLASCLEIGLVSAWRFHSVEAQALQLIQQLDAGEAQTRQPDAAVGAQLVEQTIRRSYLILFVVGIVGVVGGVVLTNNMARLALAQNLETEQLNRERESQNRQRLFESQLGRGLDMAQEEGDALRLVSQALTQAAPGMSVEVLLADSSRAHLERAAATAEAGATRCCNVATPNQCPAVREGHRLSFESTTQLDACPHMHNRPTGKISATCIPLSIMGQTAGVLHAVSPDGQLPTDVQVRTLEKIASQSSERLGLIRAFRQTEAQATRDPLTGLMNRRSLEQRVNQLTRQGKRFSVAYGDLDHFKKLNDTYGHETGDKALRLFAQQLKGSVRPTDTAARWGGEEFVLVLPESDTESAVAIIERMRISLAAVLESAGMPKFTISFGVAQVAEGELFADVLARADTALLNAKRSGRNRTLIAEVGGLTVRKEGEPGPIDAGDAAATTPMPTPAHLAA